MLSTLRDGQANQSKLTLNASDMQKTYVGVSVYRNFQT